MGIKTSIALLIIASGLLCFWLGLYQGAVNAQSPIDCDPIYEDAERADTPAERQALAQLYIACMVRENWR